MLPELLTAGDRSHSAAPHIQTEKHTDSYLHLLPYFPLQFLSTRSVLPLWPASSDTPAAAAGSRSWGRRRSGQPWLRTGTPPSRSEWRSSGRPPPWWCCGRRLPGCSKERTGQHSAAICHRHRNTWKGLTETDWKIKRHLPGFQFPVLPAEVFTYQCTRQAPPFRRHSWMKPMHSLKCCELGKKNNNNWYMYILQLLTNYGYLVHRLVAKKQVVNWQTGMRDFTSLHPLKKSCMLVNTGSE